jgi:hypothetical protein
MGEIGRMGGAGVGGREKGVENGDVFQECGPLF